MGWWNRYIQIPFAEKGRDYSGADCWGLVRLVYKLERSIELPSYTELYERTQDKEVISLAFGVVSQCWKEVTVPQAFDVVVLNITGLPVHVGLVTKPGYMIHCAKDVGTVHERIDSLRWKNKVAGYFRYE